MNEISQDRRIKNYYKIFEVISAYPTLSIYDISVRTGLSRNTVSKYMRSMYEKNIILGPHIRMKSSLDYKEYVYLMNFSDPYAVFKGLRGFPHVLYHAVTFGDWNTLVITNRLLDLSHCFFISAHLPDITRAIICLLYDLKSKQVIRKFHHAAVMYHLY